MRKRIGLKGKRKISNWRWAKQGFLKAKGSWDDTITRIIKKYESDWWIIRLIKIINKGKIIRITRTYQLK